MGSRSWGTARGGEGPERWEDKISVFMGGFLLQALGAQPLGASRRLRTTPQNCPLPGGDYPPTGDWDSPNHPPLWSPAGQAPCGRAITAPDPG